LKQQALAEQQGEIVLKLLAGLSVSHACETGSN